MGFFIFCGINKPVGNLARKYVRKKSFPHILVRLGWAGRRGMQGLITPRLLLLASCMMSSVNIVSSRVGYVILKWVPLFNVESYTVCNRHAPYLGYKMKVFSFEL